MTTVFERPHHPLRQGPPRLHPAPRGPASPPGGDPGAWSEPAQPADGLLFKRRCPYACRSATRRRRSRRSRPGHLSRCWLDARRRPAGHRPRCDRRRCRRGGDRPERRPMSGDRDGDQPGPGAPAGDSPGETLLRVENLVKHFEIRGGLLGISKIGARAGRRRRQLHRAEGRDARPRRRVGLRDDHPGQGDFLRLLPAHLGQGGPSRTRSSSTSPRRPAEGRSQGLEPADGPDEGRPGATSRSFFQDPYASLNPRMSVGEIVGEGPLVPRTDRQGQARGPRPRAPRPRRLNQSHIHRYPHEFSGGQRAADRHRPRARPQPDFVVCDEPSRPSTFSIQSQVLNSSTTSSRSSG